MRLEGTLDAFGLPDLLQLLSTTRKTGALVLRQPDGGQAVSAALYLREGALIGARPDLRRQTLLRRLIGTGLVTDETLVAVLAQRAAAADPGLVTLLLTLGSLDAEVVREIAQEQAQDAVFELLRWSDGEFSFNAGATDPDDVGLNAPVELLMAEGQRRLASWPALRALVPTPQAVLRLAPAPVDEPVLSRDEWTLLTCIDGWRTVEDIVDLSGRGEYAVMVALAALVDRGLVTALAEPADEPFTRRQALLGQLEQAAAAPGSPAARPAPETSVPAVPVARTGNQGDGPVDEDLLTRLMAGVRGL